MVTADVRQITVASTDELADKFKQVATCEKCMPCLEIEAATMGGTLLSKRLAKSISFDPDLTNNEDNDFCLRAKAKGFKMMRCPNIVAVDVNNYRMGHSDLHIDTPLRYALRGIKKKSRAQVYAYTFGFGGWRGFFQFFSENRRYVFYLIYIPVFIATIFGVLSGNIFLSVAFPVYLFLYFLLQYRRRGFLKGLKAVVRSLLVGIPNSIWTTYYCIKAMAGKKI